MIHDYSNLDYLEYRTTLGARYNFHRNVGVFGQVSYYNVSDDQPYLQDATGNVTLISGGFNWFF